MTVRAAAAAGQKVCRPRRPPPCHSEAKPKNLELETLRQAPGDRRGGVKALPPFGLRPGGEILRCAQNDMERRAQNDMFPVPAER